MAIKRFEELRVYQMAFEAAMRIFELSKGWPKEELYSLTDQIRRASRSVCANIAEGWRKRRYQRHFISKLTDADGEAAETRVFLSFAFHCGYLEESDYVDLDKTYDRISGGLVNMMTNPEKWCGSAYLVREDGADYNVDA